jgi:hypothetical protein
LTRPGVRSFGRVNGGLIFEAAYLIDRGSVPLLSVFYSDKSYLKGTSHWLLYCKCIHVLCILCTCNRPLGQVVKGESGVQSHSDLDGVGSIPAIPNARYVPSLLCHELFNEASLPAYVTYFAYFKYSEFNLFFLPDLFSTYTKMFELGLQAGSL